MRSPVGNEGKSRPQLRKKPNAAGEKLNGRPRSRQNEVTMDKLSKLRPFLLARILYERTDEEHFLTTAQLMEILEREYGIKTHRQTIPSDVETLRAYGMEIQEVMSAQKRYNLISREYDLAEIKLLIDAVESAKFISKKKSEDLAAKLARMAGRSQAEKLRRNISVEDRVRYENENIYLIIDGVNQAINAGRKISFQYFKYDEHKEPRLRNNGEPFVFSPHRLVWNGDFYYMVGVFDDDKTVGIFRIDRIVKRPELLEEAAAPLPADFDFNTYLQASFRMFGVEHIPVELICAHDVMDAILDKFGMDVETCELDEEHFLARVEVAVSNVFFSWIFGFGGKVRIAGPEEVKARYREMVLRAAEELQTEAIRQEEEG